MNHNEEWWDYNTWWEKYSFHIFILRKSRNCYQSESDRETEDCYIDYNLLFSRVVLYSRHHLALLLFSRRDYYPILGTCWQKDWQRVLWSPAYIISQRLLTSACQPMWPASACQPAWANYTHAALVFLFTQLEHGGSVKVNMQLRIWH